MKSIERRFFWECPSIDANYQELTSLSAAVFPGIGVDVIFQKRILDVHRPANLGMALLIEPGSYAGLGSTDTNGCRLSWCCHRLKHFATGGDARPSGGFRLRAAVPLG